MSKGVDLHWFCFAICLVYNNCDVSEYVSYYVVSSVIVTVYISFVTIDHCSFPIVYSVYKYYYFSSLK